MQNFPTPSRVQANLIPPVNPDYDSWSYGAYPGGNVWDSGFPGGGHNDHQFTELWTDAPAQEAEAPASLALAKPQIIENDDQSEASRFFYPARNSALS